MSNDSTTRTVAIGQIAPVWLDQAGTIAKVEAAMHEAADQNATLIAFGEALVPGYPFWSERTDGARFESPMQKEFYAHYVDQAVDIERGDLDSICTTAADRNIAVMLGTIERTHHRGHSLYATLVYIDQSGVICSTHRKLSPTYDERLNWAPGDGNGLQVHPLPPFRVGGLNCWENWMPLPRAAMYAQGEDLHVASWPGGVHNTQDITRFIAREGRSFVLSASSLMRKSDIGDHVPHADFMRDQSEDMLANGGSCIAGPDGKWVVEPVVDQETVIVATLDHQRVRAERQNFDAAGHYARPDVTELIVDRRRQSTVMFIDE